jgi:hypothetical protein
LTKCKVFFTFENIEGAIESREQKAESRKWREQAIESREQKAESRKWREQAIESRESRAES